MRVNLNLEETEEFRQYVKHLIAGQVRSIIREEMGGIIATELAKLRLLQPDSPVLADLVQQRVEQSVKNIVAGAQHSARQQMKTLIRTEIARQVKPDMETLKRGIRDELTRLIKELP